MKKAYLQKHTSFHLYSFLKSIWVKMISNNIVFQLKFLPLTDSQLFHKLWWVCFYDTSLFHSDLCFYS